MQFHFFPILQTNRLTLRKLEVDDLPYLVTYANNKKIADHIANMPHPYREPDAAFKISYVMQGHKQGNRLTFSIISKEHAHLIGEIAIHDLSGGTAEIGYWLGEPFWRQGLMTEAIGAICGFAFEKYEKDSVVASCRPNNVGSISALKKVGFEQVSTTSRLLEFRLVKAPSKD